MGTGRDDPREAQRTGLLHGKHANAFERPRAFGHITETASAKGIFFFEVSLRAIGNASFRLDLNSRWWVLLSP